SPYDDGVHVGEETVSANSLGNVSFLDGFAELDVQTVGGSGSCNVTIEVYGNTPIWRFGDGIHRYYVVTPTDCSGMVSDLTLKYEDEELHGIDETTLIFYRWDGTAWNNEGVDVRDTANNKLIKVDVNTFSPWAFGTASQTPTAVGLRSISLSGENMPAFTFIFLTGLLILVTSVFIWQKKLVIKR
ncbi:MAG: hypothetical protein KAG66_10395, partial [Methylococcales bacterium]|nr:hypothetical protein [Methylococcales bacterium]